MKPLVNDAKTRFSSRVSNYVRYRPGYPPEVIRWLQGRIGLHADWTVADVGAGTGLSAKPFVDAGGQVLGVEPNADMRSAMIAWLGAAPNFRAVDGSAESTSLPDRSVDLIVCGQAFHWFDVEETRREFARILRDDRQGGYVALMWNDRVRAGSGFAEEYESLLRRYGIDYEKVRHDRIPEDRVAAFFSGGKIETSFPNRQDFDFDGLRGRLMSASYAPTPGHPNHGPMISALRGLFDRHRSPGGTVTFEYRTRLFCGRVATQRQFGVEV